MADTSREIVEAGRFIPGVSFDANAKITEEMQKKVRRMYDLAETRTIVNNLRAKICFGNDMG